jgi:hypothetical protein
MARAVPANERGKVCDRIGGPLSNTPTDRSIWGQPRRHFGELIRRDQIATHPAKSNPDWQLQRTVTAWR